MRERQRLRQIFIQTQHSGNGARDLRHLNGMRQAVPEMIGDARREDLRLVFQAAERAGMNHAVPVALKLVAIRMGKLRIAPSPGACDWKFKMGEVPGHRSIVLAADFAGF